MINGKKVLALIPARGGSKRLQRKNVLLLNDKPLIAWTIEAAKQCKYIDNVVVTTDDQEITDVSLSYGADVPFTRPAELSSDTATSYDVTIHALKALESEEFDIVLLLQPTSPLRNMDDISQALELMIERNAKGVVTVCECEHSPLWANTLPKSGSLDNFIQTKTIQRSQDLEKYYRLNGAIYSYDINYLVNQGGISYGEDVYALIMEQHHSVDIDTSLDFIMTEAIIAANM